MARGTEGCGVTKFATEQLRWLRKHGHEARVFTMRDKAYSRAKTHDTNDFTKVKFADDAEFNEMLAWCDACDVVFVNSMPPKENGHTSPLPDHAYENWARFIREVRAPIAIVQHDHKIYSLKRNALMDELIDRADMVFVHSPRNDFADYLRDFEGEGLRMFFDDEPGVPRKKLFSFQPGFSFDDSRWVPVGEQDARHHKWIGRSTSWKGYRLMFEFSKLLCLDPGVLVTLEGLEKSPGFLSIKGQYDFHSHVSHIFDLIERVDLEPYRGTKPAVFSSFVNEKLVARMARVGFGYQTSLLEPKFIDRSIEYTHCEVVQAGAVPVFRQEYGQLCRHRVTGDPLTESKNNFTIWLGAENHEACINTVRRLTDDPVERDEWRRGALEFYGAHQDSEHTFAEMMKHVEDVLKMKSAA